MPVGSPGHRDCIDACLSKAARYHRLPHPEYGARVYALRIDHKVLCAEFVHKAYREKSRQYADEEKRLWEDFRHGMIIGTKEFVVDKIRSKYIPDHIHKEISQHYARCDTIAIAGYPGRQTDWPRHL